MSLQKVVLCAALFAALSGCSSTPECDDCDPIIIVSTDTGILEPDVAPEPFCGDGVVDDGEVCDDGVENGEPGSCDADCEGVELCGNDVVDEGEDCDGGTDHRCSSLGFDGGVIRCTDQCVVDMTACVGSRSLPEIVDTVAAISADQRWAIVGGASINLLTFDIVHHGDRFHAGADFYPFENGWMRVETSDGTRSLKQGTFGTSGEKLIGHLYASAEILVRPDGMIETVLSDGESPALVLFDGPEEVGRIAGTESGFFGPTGSTTAVSGWPTVWQDYRSGESKEVDGRVDKISADRAWAIVEFDGLYRLLDTTTGEVQPFTQEYVNGFSTTGRFAYSASRETCVGEERSVIFTNIATQEKNETPCFDPAGNTGYVKFGDTDEFVILIVDRYQGEWVEDLMFFDTETWTYETRQTIWAGRQFWFNGDHVLYRNSRTEPTSLLLSDLGRRNTERVGDYYESSFAPYENGWIQYDNRSFSDNERTWKFISFDGTVRDIYTVKENEDMYGPTPDAYTIGISDLGLFSVALPSGERNQLTRDGDARFERASEDWVFFTDYSTDRVQMIAVPK